MFNIKALYDKIKNSFNEEYSKTLNSNDNSIINNNNNLFTSNNNIKQENLKEIICNYFPNRNTAKLKLISNNHCANSDQFFIENSCEDYLNVFSSFYLNKILDFWELVLFETPILVLSDTPDVCSQVIIALESLISPLTYVGDVRPYFTIYDQDFKNANNNLESLKKNSPMFGVINPLLAKHLSDYVIINFNDFAFKERNMENLTKLNIQSLKQEQQQQEEEKSNNKTNNNNNKEKEDIKKGKNIDLLDENLNINFISNFKNKKFFLKNKRKEFLKILKSYNNSNNNDNLNNNFNNADKINLFIKLFLDELNSDFIRTFEDYFFLHEKETLKRIAFYKSKISIFEIFKKEKFFNYLKNSSNVYFNTKYINNIKKTIEFYSKFIETKCFNRYLENIL